jgi:hypothetical protein
MTNKNAGHELTYAENVVAPRPVASRKSGAWRPAIFRIDKDLSGVRTERFSKLEMSSCVVFEFL